MSWCRLGGVLGRLGGRLGSFGPPHKVARDPLSESAHQHMVPFWCGVGLGGNLRRGDNPTSREKKNTQDNPKPGTQVPEARVPPQKAVDGGVESGARHRKPKHECSTRTVGQWATQPQSRSEAVGQAFRPAYAKHRARQRKGLARMQTRIS